MANRGLVFVVALLYAMMMPGLLFHIPGKSKIVEFGNFHTSGASILVHTIIHFTHICIFLLVISIHIYIDL